MESLAGRVVLLSGWRRSLGAFLAGGFASLAQPPFDFFAACFVSFPVLVWLLDGAVGEGRGLRALVIPAFKTGWWFGFGYFMLGLWWIGNALLVDAGNFAWAVPLAIVGLPAFLSIFYAVSAVFARLFWHDGILRIISLAFFFGVAESIRGIIFTGFPWGAIGYAAMPTLLSMQSAKVFGLAGMNFLAVLVFSMPALLGTRRHLLIGSITAIGLVSIQFAYGYLSLSREVKANDFLSVRIVQPSIKQTEKWDSSEQTRIFNILLDLTQRQVASGTEKPELIVWPETAVPFLFTERPEALVQLGEALDEGQLLLTGAVRAEGDDGLGRTRYYNSVVAIAQDGTIVDAVDKVHLVPFGEYVPFANLLNNLGIEEIVQSAGPFTAGGARRPINLAEGVRVMPFICYEIIFPHLVSAVADQSDVLLNLTNDAWFGMTPGPYQHFRQARIRAVENGRPLLRAANAGISAVIDSSGRIIDAFDLNVVGSLDVQVPIQKPEKLYFENPGTNGMFIAFGFGAVLFGSSIVRRLRAN